MTEIDKDSVTFGEELTMQDILKLKRGKARIYAEAPPNDPSSTTPAQAAANPQPEGEKGVRCSGLLGQSNQPSIGAENQSGDLSQQPLPTYLSRRIHLLRDDVQLYRQSGESSSVPLRPFPTQISEMKKWAIQLGYENDVLEAYFQSGWFEKLQARSDWPNS